MELSNRDAWAVFHGLVAGGIFLLAFAGALAGLWSMSRRLTTREGVEAWLRRLVVGTWSLAVISWAAVMTGTYVVYPWYREATPDSPRSILLADPNTELWHRFAFEWKEHVAFLAPILATAVAFIVTYYGTRLADKPRVRYAAMAMFTIAFAAAVLAAVFGALVTKKAPV
jgi:hypothetical protein